MVRTIVLPAGCRVTERREGKTLMVGIFKVEEEGETEIVDGK